MKKFSIIIATLFLFSCTTVTKIKLPEGDTILVESKSNALVRVTRADTKIEIDNRGKPTFLEQLISMLFMKGDWMTKNAE